MNITTERVSDSAVIHFAGDADAAAVPAIRQVLGDAVEDVGPRLICDLSGVEYICSEALGAFISAYQGVREAGGYLKLLRPQQRIADILTTTQLNRLFMVCASLDDALRTNCA